MELSEKLKRDVVTFLEQLAVEFGCLDIVHDGHDNYYIVDLNLTPYAGRRPIDNFLTDFLRFGIWNTPQRQLSDFINSPLILSAKQAVVVHAIHAADVSEVWSVAG